MTTEKKSESFTLSLGGEGNLTAGRDIAITLTQVESIPCADPYCDAIIAVEKAENRNGLCGNCYKAMERTELNTVYAPLRMVYLFFAALALFFLFFMGLSFLLDANNKEIIDNMSGWLFVTVVTFFVFTAIFAVTQEKRISKKYDLRERG